MAQTLGSVAVGTVVKINEGGSPVEFYVSVQNYESSLNGAGRTLVVRKDCQDNRRWTSSNVNDWASSSILFWLNNTYKKMMDSDIQSLIGTTTYYYTPGNGNYTVTTRSDALFLLSMTELGKSHAYANVEGTALPIANILAIAHQHGRAVTQWTRSPHTGNTSNIWSLDINGSANSSSYGDTRGPRPAFTLPSSLYVWGDGTVSQYVGPAPSYITTPSLTMQGQPINVSWSSADDADSYILQRKADSGEWTQVYAGTATSYTDTAGSWTTVQYQVCGVFDGANGVFAQSEVITVVPASALVISGTDGDLGTITSDISYSMATDTGNPISLTLTVNSAQFFSGSVGTSYTSKIPVMDLPTGTNTIVITATVEMDSDPVTVTRTWTYTKAAVSFPTSGGVAALSQNGQPIFPQTLAEAVKATGGPWGGNLSTALDKLALAATYRKAPIPKYAEVKVDLSKVQAGDIVNLPVNGVMVPHIVVQVGNPDPEMYDSSCDGVWLLRQEIVELGEWNITNINTLAGSTIMTTMQGYVTDYDSAVQAAIQTVKIPYCVGGGGMTIKTLSNGLSCKMFPLNAYEIGTEEVSTIPLTGKKLDYFLSGNNAEGFAKRIFNYNGSPKDWLTRDPQPETSDRYIQIDYRGYAQVSLPMSMEPAKGYLPCFLLPTTFAATYYVDESGTVYPSQEYTTAGDFYDLWGNVIPTVKIATGNYTGTGTYGSDNPNTLTFSFEPKFILILRTILGGNLRFGYLIPQNGIFFSCQNGYSTTPPSASDTTSISASGNSVSWYYTSAEGQFNASAIYHYVAIG